MTVYQVTKEFRMQSRFALVSLFLLAVLHSLPARADRGVLAPTGDCLAPNTVKTQFAIDGQKRNSNRIWLQYASPGGVELEVERTDLASERSKGYAFNLQYPIAPSLSRAIPALSLGVRDLFGTSSEHGAFYFAISKTAGLSDDEYKILKDVKFNFGVGTGRIAGFFVGAQIQFKNRVRFSAEAYQRKVNLDISVPLVSGLEAKAYSLNNHIFYGLSYSFSH